MDMLFLLCLLGISAAIALLAITIYRLFLHPLKTIAGPWTYSISPARLLWDDILGHTSRKVLSLHAAYGPVLRLAPDHVTFDSMPALKAIYGVGSRSNRTSFYKIFEPYGVPTMFTMSSSGDHAERKKHLVRCYAKTGIMKGSVAEMIETKTKQLLRLFENECNGMNICHPLYYLTMDISSGFIFTREIGTQTLGGSEEHRALLRDLGTSRRGPWSSVSGVLWTRMLQLLDMQKAIGFKYVRAWAKDAFEQYRQMRAEKRVSQEEVALINELWDQREKRQDSQLRDIDLVSECADHLVAGVETTRDTLIFLIWAMSLDENKHLQARIKTEVANLGHYLFQRERPADC